MLPIFDKKIPVIFIVGNHDNPGAFIKTNALDVFNYIRVENCFVFSKPGKIKIKTKNGEIQFVGIPWAATVPKK